MSHNAADPVRIRDIACASQALEKLLGIHRSTCAAFGKPDRESFRRLNVVRDLLADLRRSRTALLTHGQRELIARVLGVQRLPSAAVDTPEALRFLPRKPPGHPDFGPLEGSAS